MGNVLVEQGNVDGAIANYEAEIRIYPSFAEGHNNLARALFRKGDISTATAHLKTALRLKPNYAEARNNLGIALSQSGEILGAITQWNKSLELQADNIDAHCNLAWVLATSPDNTIRDGSKAIKHAERALQLSGEQNPRIWRLAAAAYAENGQFPEATKAAENGLALAESQGDSALVRTLEMNIARFRENSPIRDTTPAK
jgi:superkiller protein 3